MDLQKAWEKINFKNEVINREAVLEAMRKDSNSILDKLTHGLKAKLKWCLGFLAFFSLILGYSLWSGNTQVSWIMLFFIMCYLLAYLLINSQLKKINPKVEMSANTLEVLKQYYEAVKKTLRIEEIWGLCFYPFAGLGGIMFSLSMYGMSFEAMFSDSEILTIMLISIAVLTPAGTLLARWMNKRAFGKYLTRLRENIAQMEMV